MKTISTARLNIFNKAILITICLLAALLTSQF